MFSFFKKIAKRGFTLAEILVVIFIIALLSALIFANYKEGQDNLKLTMAANKLAQDLREMQERAMAAEEYKVSSNPDIFVVPEGGYGIHLRKRNEAFAEHYYLFADLGPDPNHKYDSGAEKFEDIDLGPQGIRIQSLTGGNLVNVVFSPPDPTVWLVNNDDPPVDIGSILTIVVCLMDAQNECTTKIKTITINKAGLITVQ